jgi:hypothetical protein
VCDRLRETPGEDLLRAKLALEARLDRKTGLRCACAAQADECLAAYAELLAQPWEKSRVPKGGRLLLATAVPSSVSEKQAVLSLRAGAADLQSLLGRAPAPTTGGAASIAGQLDAPSAGDDGTPTCGEDRAFYDRLFARDEVWATIAFGYLDEHLTTLRGYVRHVLLKLDPIPVFLRSQEELIAEVRTRFSRDGFVVESLAPTELVLSRRFYYRGQPKTLRVRAVFSIARCPGETPDEFGRLWRFDDQTCPAQRQATAQARLQLARSFATNAIVVYHGHARRGRGLDFGPMSLDDGKLSLDCESLECGAAGASQTLVFVNGCDTVLHYGAALTKLGRSLPAGHALAWLGTRGGALTMNAPQMSLRLLDLLVEGKCPEDILAVLNLPRQHAEDLSQVEGEGL